MLTEQMGEYVTVIGILRLRASTRCVEATRGRPEKDIHGSQEHHAFLVSHNMCKHSAQMTHKHPNMYMHTHLHICNDLQIHIAYMYTYHTYIDVYA